MVFDVKSSVDITRDETVFDMEPTKNAEIWCFKFPNAVPKMVERFEMLVERKYLARTENLKKGIELLKWRLFDLPL